MLAILDPSRPHKSNPGPRAKFGPKCNHIWPARSIKCTLELARSFYHIFYFKLNVISHVFLISGFEIWLFQILCLSKIKAFFRMKRIKVTYQLQLIFQLLARDLLHCLLLAHCEFEFDSPDLDKDLSSFQSLLVQH